MSQVRMSTQVNDDESRLLTDANKLVLQRAVQSIPDPGQYTVVRIKREADGQFALEWDDSPI